MLKFKEEKAPGLLGMTTIFTQVGSDDKPLDPDDPFRVMSDRGGVRFMGTSRRLETQQDFEIFAKTVGAAAVAFQRAIPKVTNAAGH